MSLLELVKPYYEELANAGRAPVLGQIVWTPVPNLPPHPTVLEATRVDPKSHAAATARSTPMADTHFRKRSGKELPILHLKLGETEELVAYRAKMRPGVVVGDGSETLGGLEIGTPPHHEERRVVVAPIYGLRTDDDLNGFGATLATRVRHLLYRQFFPLAPWTEKRRVDGGRSLEEGIIRFDRLQFATRARPSLVLAPLKLSEEALAFLHTSLWVYLHAQPSAELAEAREVLRELLPPDVAPGSA